MKSIKFYMNNPCEVIREISPEFSEVKVYPKYIDEEASGGDWCCGCLAGHLDGTPNHHDCDKYQEVIDYINDTESSMIIVVENRLLQSDPVEFKPWDNARKRTQELSDRHNKIYRDSIALDSRLATRSQLLVDVNEEIEDAKSEVSVIRDNLNNLYRELSYLNAQIKENEDLVSIGSVQISLTGADIRDMLKSKIILESLESGGVDDWEWYGESMPDGDVEDLVQDEIEKLQVKSL